MIGRFFGNFLGNFTKRGRLRFSYKKQLLVATTGICLAVPVVFWFKYGDMVSHELKVQVFELTLDYYLALGGLALAFYTGSKVHHKHISRDPEQ